MISYFDSSALVALLLDEPTSEQAKAVWNASDRSVSVLLAYGEVRAALAAAGRAGRLDRRAAETARALLEALMRQLDLLDVDEPLVRLAGELAQTRALKGYDAVHLAAAQSVADSDTLFVSGDRALCMAAHASGMQVSRL